MGRKSRDGTPALGLAPHATTLYRIEQPPPRAARTLRAARSTPSHTPAVPAARQPFQLARNSSTAACWCSLIVNLRACRVSLQWMVSLMIHRIGERAFTTRRQRCDEGGASAIASFWLRFSFAGFNVVLPRGEGGGHTHLLVLVHRRVAPRRQGFY